MTSIERITLTPVNISRRTGLVCGHVIVEITTDDGLIGLGEMSDFQHLPMYHVDIAGLELTLQSILAGLDIESTNEAARRLEDAFPSAGNLYDKGAVIRCGVDIALWDLRGKLLSKSVSDLLGGRVREAIPVAYPIFRQASPEDVEVNLDRMEQVVSEGFKCFRVYVGRDLDLDERFLLAARERFGSQIVLKSLDFSNLLDAVEAARFIDRTSHLGYELVEAPARAGDLEGLAYIRRTSRVPVSEHVYNGRSALQLVANRSVDVLNVGLFVLGGITKALEVTAIADAAGLRCLVGTTQELGIGTAAAAHFGVSAPSVSVPSDPVGPLLYTSDVVANPIQYRDGELIPPQGTGLGVELDEQLVQDARGALQWGSTQVSKFIDRTG